LSTAGEHLRGAEVGSTAETSVTSADAIVGKSLTADGMSIVVAARDITLENISAAREDSVARQLFRANAASTASANTHVSGTVLRARSIEVSVAAIESAFVNTSASTEGSVASKSGSSNETSGASANSLIKISAFAAGSSGISSATVQDAFIGVNATAKRRGSSQGSSSAVANIARTSSFIDRGVSADGMDIVATINSALVHIRASSEVRASSQVH